MNLNCAPDVESLCLTFDKHVDISSKTEDSDLVRRNLSTQHRPLTISTLAHYFGLQCDEYLRLTLNPSSESTKSETLTSFLTKQRGISFEEKLKAYYSASILSNVTTSQDFLSYLRSALLNPVKDLRIGYNVKFPWTYDQSLQSNYKPDFLLMRHSWKDGHRIEITIADAKSSARMRVEHCVQVALYGIDLRVWIERNQLDQRVYINSFGEIWLPNENSTIPYEKKTFPMMKLQDKLRYFLRHDLQEVLSGSKWIMLPRCSLCPYVSRCRQRALHDKPESLNNLSYLTRTDHSLIHSFFRSTSASSIDLNLILDELNTNEIYSSEKARLQQILAIDPKEKKSALIEALQTREPQLKSRTSFLIPKINQDLILLFLFLIPNPSQLHSVALFAYNIYDMFNQTWFSSQPIVQTYPSPSQVVCLIAEAFDQLRRTSSRPCQIVLFDEQERTALFEQLTLASDCDLIGDCLVLLSSSENAILLDYPPDVIQQDRLFRSHPLSNVKKDDIEQELNDRYGLIVDKTKTTSKLELAQQLRQLNNQEQEDARRNLVGLPCLISLHTAIRQSFVVPTPGYFDLEDLKSSFQISLPSSKPTAIFEAITNESAVDDLVKQYFDVLTRLYSIIQTRLSESNRLQLEAIPLPIINSIRSSHSHIRRLIFLRQYEMLYSLRSIQQARFDMNEPPILIRILKKIPVDRYNNSWECQIERGQEIISKNFLEDVTNNSEFRTYSYLISKDNYSIQTFPDAVYMDSAIEGLRSRTKLNQYGLAHVELNGENGTILLRMKLGGLSLGINQEYYLSERYVDFTTKKAIQALEQVTPLTIQIFDDPRRLERPEAIQKSSRDFQQEITNIFSKREPSIKPDGLHMLNKAQQVACEKVKNERVTLIWGPPGTGKTYWSSVTVFQMLMFSKSPLHILITACTHTAIDNLLNSIKYVKHLFSSSSQFPRWCELAKELQVMKIDSKNYRDLLNVNKKSSWIIGSTGWTLQKLDRSIIFDIIFVDEATQLLTSDAVLALNRLADHRESRLIVAGDPLQLSPVKRCTYPTLPHPTPDLFSSLFHCLLRDENNSPICLQTEKPFEQISRCPYLSIFDENHRMNEQLSDFTRLLYGENYRQGRSKPLLSVCPIDETHEYLLGSLLEPYSSLYTILVDSFPSSSLSTRLDDIFLESNLVCSLVEELVLRISPSSIFIITPHRMQRSVIRQKLPQHRFSTVSITCDTVERMQGKEAQCVILCMLYRQSEILENELDFLYNRQRINVSITRAQQLCILLTSQLMFNQPPLDLFINENTRNAYTLLSNYINKSIIRYLDNEGNVK
ncbi:unnamed protein product [Adineta ricciae]|uniref:DNA2/NAM7 helicase-like C-terminal domain-containing protein n=1 Tax=Adineta ricciae TaxID=249248 RepID=A0A815TXZ9_ADIRI|nr:unnamed protein product [Adineta ricciae]CAF1511004.1 unnamed protein product [Adineta ricciae]